MRLLLGAVAGLVVVGTGFLVVAAGRALALDQMFTGGPLTAGNVAGLFGLMVIVVGAADAVRWLISRIVRRRGRDDP